MSRMHKWDIISCYKLPYFFIDPSKSNTFNWTDFFNSDSFCLLKYNLFLQRNIDFNLFKETFIVFKPFLHPPKNQKARVFYVLRG